MRPSHLDSHEPCTLEPDLAYVNPGTAEIKRQIFPISHNQSGDLCSMSSAAYGVIRTILRDSSDAFSTAVNNTFLDSDGLVRC